jgi:hypothetical protein
VSSAPEGWYVDPSTGTNARYWDGSTWTDEVAPLPHEHTNTGRLFGPAETTVTVPEPAVEAARGAPARPPEQSATAEARDLDPDIERTRISRRELRARRGIDDEPDDTADHLPPMTPQAAVPVEARSEPVEELEIPAASTAGQPLEEWRDVARRRRMVRIAVVLVILAFATGVAIAVLTGGTL